jgi:hypothetical protein
MKESALLDEVKGTSRQVSRRPGPRCSACAHPKRGEIDPSSDGVFYGVFWPSFDRVLPMFSAMFVRPEDSA